MDFRAKIAMFGHMGVEADPAAMSSADRAILSAHIALYKEWRDVIHGGVLSQISDPRSGVIGYQVLTPTRGLALIAQTKYADHYCAPPVRMRGLAPSEQYRVCVLLPDCSDREAIRRSEIGSTMTVLAGHALMQSGIVLPTPRPETAWLISLEQVHGLQG